MSTEDRELAGSGGAGRLRPRLTPALGSALGRGWLLPWWAYIGGGTLIILGWLSPWMKVRHPGLYRFKAWVLDLSVEMTFGVWWSAMLLLLCAALLYENSTREASGLRRAYVQLSFVFAALAFDEIGSFHEWLSGIGGWTALAPFGLLIVFLLGDSLRRLWADRPSRTVFWLLCAGLLVFATVPIQEYLEHNVTTERWGRRYGRYVEEATELVGSHIVLLAAVYRRLEGRLAGGLAAVVPDPRRMPHLLPVLAGGFFAHLLLAQAPLLEIGQWDGGPAAVYPFAAFLLLASYCFWVPFHRSPESAGFAEVRGFWAAFGLLFLFCSIGNIQNLWGLVNGIVPGLNRNWFQQMVALYMGLNLAALFVGCALWRRRGKRLLWLLGLPLTLVIIYNLHHPSRKELAAGVYAVICILAFMRATPLEADREPPG